MHLLKNGHPAHVFTDEERRKAAAVTNEIRRQKRDLAAQLWINQEMERMLAAREARRRRKREKQRARRAARRQAEQVEAWLERGYGARSPTD
jgi:CRISPR/Cas system-associated endonuclease Cas1